MRMPIWMHDATVASQCCGLRRGLVWRPVSQRTSLSIFYVRTSAYRSCGLGGLPSVARLGATSTLSAVSMHTPTWMHDATVDSQCCGLPRGLVRRPVTLL